ncbi:MAG: tetratricopeptide repeat protein [candidate division WOR-3 bacterium]
MKKIKKEDYDQLLETAQFYLLNKNYKEAIEVFKEALKIKEDYLIYYQLGIAYEGLNEIDKAKEMYRKSLELKPDFDEANKRLDELVKE